jgi:RNA polymerase sigma-70 factor (sigma-E family)
MTFDEYVQARLPVLLRFATVLTGDRGLAEDVVQEVLVRAHSRWQRVSGVAAPDLYVRRMIVNEFISWRRRWGRVVPVETVVPARSDTPDHAWVHAEREELAMRLARLPRRQQTVLVLRFYEDLSDVEIADLLGCRPATVRGYAARALAALRAEQRQTVFAKE